MKWAPGLNVLLPATENLALCSLGHYNESCGATEMWYFSNSQYLYHEWFLTSSVNDAMMIVMTWNAFHIAGPLWGESTCDWWIPLRRSQ